MCSLSKEQSILLRETIQNPIISFISATSDLISANGFSLDKSTIFMCGTNLPCHKLAKKLQLDLMELI